MIGGEDGVLSMLLVNSIYIYFAFEFSRLILRLYIVLRSCVMIHSCSNYKGNTYTSSGYRMIE